MIYLVEVKKSHLHPTKACDWIGGNSYRCGHCETGVIKVRSDDQHDAACSSCQSKVTVKSREVYRAS